MIIICPENQGDEERGALILPQGTASRRCGRFSASPVVRREKRRLGVTLIEILVVLAIVGVVLGIGFINGRRIVTSQDELAALNSLRQSVWQGVTAAAARGRIVTLRLEGSRLVVRVGTGSGGAALRTEALPTGISTNMPQGQILVFTPPGKIEINSLGQAQGYWMQSSKGRSNLEFSVVGEVRFE